MKYLNNINTLEELKKEFRKLVFKLHPDVGGSDEEMKILNAEYEIMFERVKNIHVNKDGEFYTKETDETPEEFRDLINELLKMAGIDVEIIGTFVWVTGDTKPHKEELKGLGFRWHSKKKCWYKAPKDYHKRSRKTLSLDDIREMYGSTKINRTNNSPLMLV